MKTAINKILDEQLAIRKSFSSLRAKNSLARMYRLAQMYLKEARSPIILSLRHLIRAWSHGMKQSTYRAHGLEISTNIEGYISDTSSLKLLYLNGRFHELLGNKLTFLLLMKYHNAPIPEMHGIIQSGLYHPSETEKIISPSDMLKQLCIPDETIVFKPIWGASGKGFFTVFKHEHGYRLNNEDVSYEDLLHLISTLDNYMVTEYIRQAAYGKNMYPYTANTIRIITMQDPDHSGAFIADAGMRIGTLQSYPVDSFGAGGLYAEIDINSGELGSVAEKKNRNLIRHTHHPETNAPIKGTSVPSWDNICRSILELCNKLSYIPYIGWDILPTESGFTIIEGNGAPDLGSQRHGDLLADPRIKRFYKHHGIIS